MQSQNPTTARRALLGRIAAGAALAAPAAALAATQKPDPHPAWLAEVERLKAEINACATDEASNHLAERKGALESLIGETPARTMAGVRAQVTLALAHLEYFSEASAEEAGLRNALATLDQLAGRA